MLITLLSQLLQKRNYLRESNVRIYDQPAPQSCCVSTLSRGSSVDNSGDSRPTEAGDLTFADLNMMFPQENSKENNKLEDCNCSVLA